MTHPTQDFYESCNECQFADFIDFENMECSLAVEYVPATKCSSFQKIGSGSKDRINIMGEASQIVDVNPEKLVGKEIMKEDLEEKINEIHLHEAKKVSNRRKNKIIHIESSKKNNNSEKELDNRFFTLDEVRVYDSPEARLSRKIRTEPKNKLIPFEREVIRYGFDLIMLIEPNGRKVYIQKERKKVVICQQCKVKENPVDILLMSHEEFDKYAESTKPEIRQVKDEFIDEINSFVETKYGKIIATTKDIIKKDGKNITTLNIIGFKSQIPDIKIGRMAPGSNFYITYSEGDKRARKIMTDDDQQGILISHSDTYKEIDTPLRQFVNAVTILITIGIIIWGIVAMIESTGWIIIAGIFFVIIAYIVAIFIGAPLYYLLNQIVKRF